MPITIRYIGPHDAIVAGHILLHGEQRTIPDGEALRLSAERPDHFLLVAAVDDAGRLLDGLPLPADGKVRGVLLDERPTPDMGVLAELTDVCRDADGQPVDVPAGDLAAALANPATVPPAAKRGRRA
jgi:hypothetical protein